MHDVLVTKATYSVSSVFSLCSLNSGQTDAPVQQSTEAVVLHSETHTYLLTQIPLSALLNRTYFDNWHQEYW